MFRPNVFPPHSSSSVGFKGRATIGHSPVVGTRGEVNTPRPRTLPNIIGFDGFGMNQISHCKMNGYFPPRKPKSSKGTPRSNSRPSTKHQQTHTNDSLVLEANYGVTSPRPFTGVSSLASESSKNYDTFRSKNSRNTPRTANSLKTTFTPDSSVYIPDKPTFQTENTNSSGDLSYLIKPKHLEPGRHSPWVYRYTVKRSMNSLSKIMSSSSSATPSMAVRLQR